MKPFRRKFRIPIIDQWRRDWTLKKQRRERIHELQSCLERVYKEQFSGANTPQEKEEARQRIFAMTSYDENELSVLLQEDLIAALSQKGIEIPEKHWNEEEYPLKRTLMYSGEIWARNELKKHRDSRIEFWSKIILPILSLIVSIVALLKSVGR